MDHRGGDAALAGRLSGVLDDGVRVGPGLRCGDCMRRADRRLSLAGTTGRLRGHRRRGGLHTVGSCTIGRGSPDYRPQRGSLLPSHSGLTVRFGVPGPGLLAIWVAAANTLP